MKHNWKRLKHYQGFSLVELAVAMVIIGFLGVIAWSYMPKLMTLPMFSQFSGKATEQSVNAIDGFILANGRLPCPDTSANNTGIENCAPGVINGWLPARTLGLSLSERVKYGVYRDARLTPTSDIDLAVLVDRYKPSYPYGTDLTYTPRNNGLDFCIGLLNLTESGGTLLTAGALAVPIAYAIAVAGPANADGVGNNFDGRNAIAGQFELEGTAKSATYDDETKTVGSAELFERLGCTQKLAAVNSAARKANVALDVDRVADLYVEFRTFQVKIAELDNKMVDVALALAIADISLAVANAAIASQVTYTTNGAAALAVAKAVVALTASSYALAQVIIRLDTTAEKLALANKMKAASSQFKLQTFSDLNAAKLYMLTMDGKGILP